MFYQEVVDMIGGIAMTIQYSIYVSVYSPL